jgi:hypothetical protein
MRVRPPTLLLVLVLVVLAGCGSSKNSKAGAGTGGNPVQQRAIADAEKTTKADFPAPGGKTLEGLANTIKAGPKAGLAESVLLPGTNRFAFGVLAANNSFLYGRAAVYVADTPSGKARGPYAAPADPMTVEPPFRSENSAVDTSSTQAVYTARVPFPHPGSYPVLVVVKQPTGLEGAATSVTVRKSSPIPAVGELAPRIHTDTVASAGGDLNAIDTRRPHDDLHRDDFYDVVGKKPVVLLFATPALCQSRVCGPVTDIEVQLQKQFGNRATFIHEEIYANNDVAKGPRKALVDFGLVSKRGDFTEPWLFTVKANGRIAARLEGAFGVKSFTKAVEAALQ